MAKFKIYLAGAMGNVTPETAKRWRNDITLYLSQITDEVKTIDPTDFYAFDMDLTGITEKEIKEFDLHAVRNSDCVLVNLDYADSIGTAIEIECASRFWGVPVIGYGGEDKNIHAWITEALTKRTNTMRQAIAYIMEYYVTKM